MRLRRVCGEVCQDDLRCNAAHHPRPFEGRLAVSARQGRVHSNRCGLGEADHTGSDREVMVRAHRINYVLAELMLSSLSISS